MSLADHGMGVDLESEGFTKTVSTKNGINSTRRG